MYEKRKVAFRHFLSAGFTHVNLRVIHTEHWTSSRRANTLKIRSPHSRPSLEYGALRIFWFSTPDTHKANFCKPHTFWTGLGFYEECVSRTACARFCFCVCAHVCVFFCACVCVWKYCSAHVLPSFQIKSTAAGWSKLPITSRIKLLIRSTRFNSGQQGPRRKSRACINLPDSSICRGSAVQGWDFISVIPVFCASAPSHYPPRTYVQSVPCCLFSSCLVARSPATPAPKQLFACTWFNPLVMLNM